MAAFLWTDADGTWAVRSAMPAPANRFQGWEPATRDVGETEVPIGTGRPVFFALRTDYTASLALEGIRGTAPAQTIAGAARSERMLDAIDRLLQRLARGDTVTLATENAGGTTYTVVAAPGTTAASTMTDRETMEYRVSAVLLNTAAVRMAYPY